MFNPNKPKTYDNPQEDIARLERIRAGLEEPGPEPELSEVRKMSEEPSNPTWERVQGLVGRLQGRLQSLREKLPKKAEVEASTAIVSVEAVEVGREKSVGMFGKLKQKVAQTDWARVRQHFASSMGVMGGNQPFQVGEKKLRVTDQIPFWNGAKLKETLQDAKQTVREKFKNRATRDAEAGYEEIVPETTTQDKLAELGKMVDLDQLRTGLDEFYARSSYAGGKERKALRAFAEDYLAEMSVEDFADIFGDGDMDRTAVQKLAQEVMAAYGEERERRNQEQQAKWQSEEFDGNFEKLADTTVQRMAVEVYAKSLLESPRSGLPAEMVPVFLAGIQEDLQNKSPDEINLLMDPQSDATADKNAVLQYVQNYLTQPQTTEDEKTLSAEQKTNLQKTLFLKLDSRLDQSDARTREVTKTLVSNLSTDELTKLFSNPDDLNSLDDAALDALAVEVQATTRESLARKSRQDELLRVSRDKRGAEETDLAQFIASDVSLNPEVESEEIEELSNYFTQTDTGLLPEIFSDSLEQLEAELTPATWEPGLETDTERRERWERRAAQDEAFEDSFQETQEFAVEQKESEEFNFEDVQGLIEEVQESPENDLEKEREAQFETMYARREGEIDAKLEQVLGSKLLRTLALDPKAELARAMRNVSGEDLSDEEAVSSFLQEDVPRLIVEAFVDKPFETRDGEVIRVSLERLNELLARPDILSAGLEKDIQKINEILNLEASLKGKGNKLALDRLSSQELLEKTNSSLLRNRLDRLSEKVATRILKNPVNLDDSNQYRGVAFSVADRTKEGYQGRAFVRGRGTSTDYQGQAFVKGAFRAPQSREDDYRGVAFNVETGPKITPEQVDTYQGTAFVLEREVSVDESVEIADENPEFREEAEDFWLDQRGSGEE